MRIIAGEWRGRRLVAPKGDATRPTADRTRETLFNMLASRIGDFEGLAVADLFAGSGALGLEALSRGAASCLFVEHDKAALDAIRANVTALDARTRATVSAGSVMTLGPASWIAVETGAKEELTVRMLSLEAERTVGKAKLSILRLTE